jgi:hypothetical protein
VTAPRRKAPRRGALFPSAARLHAQLAKVEALQGRRGQRLFVFMPVHAEQQPATFAEGEGPQRGDLVIAFEPLHETAEEAALSLEQCRERHCQKTDLAPAPLPWKRDFSRADPPPRQDPDAELEALAEPRAARDLRPLTGDEFHQAAAGLLKSGHLFHRSVARSALSGGTVPLSDGDAFPCPGFAMTDKGTLIFRMRRNAEHADAWREATDKDRERYPLAFSRFLAQCSLTFSPTTEEKEAPAKPSAADGKKVTSL